MVEEELTVICRIKGSSIDVMLWMDDIILVNLDQQLLADHINGRTWREGCLEVL